MSTLTEGRYPGECLLTKQDGSLSFEEVTVTGGDYHDGTVLGEISSGSPPWGTGILAQYDPDAHDGTETAAAVLFGNALAALAPVAATVIVRLAEVKGERLTWKTGISDGDKAAGVVDLATNFVIVRD